jgi:hypothetical protein
MKADAYATAIAPTASMSTTRAILFVALSAILTEDVTSGIPSVAAIVNPRSLLPMIPQNPRLISRERSDVDSIAKQYSPSPDRRRTPVKQDQVTLLETSHTHRVIQRHR